MPHRLSLLVAVALLVFAPAMARAQATTDPCQALTAPGAQPCQPVPDEPAALQRFLTPDACVTYAAEAALPLLLRSHAINVAGVSPLSVAPLTQPLGSGPLLPATLFGPPRPAPTYGPLGPGETAAYLAVQAFPNGFRRSSTPSAGLRDAGTLLGLGALQLSELGNLYAREETSANYQTASAAWMTTYATQASVTYTILQGLCRGAQARPPASPSAAPSRR